MESRRAAAELEGRGRRKEAYPDLQIEDQEPVIMESSVNVRIGRCMGAQSLNRVQLFMIPRLQPTSLLCPWNSLGRNT